MSKTNGAPHPVCPKNPSGGGPHCQHVCAQPFPLQVGPQQAIGVIPQRCCFCGRDSTKYVGIMEPGHGPYNEYELPSPIAVPQMVLPNGLKGG
jgi:hypothetical protein